MEWYRKHKRAFAMGTCILFVAGLLLTLTGMTALKTTKLGTIGTILLFVSLVPVGVIWIMNSRDKEVQEQKKAETKDKPE